ncbi:hypothetical protein C7N43_00680 [Sphingobacteriales bacterium UPWRP_1]|nr:hypothetical protein B6N25_10415 [Sphingobacteriales bacterium TSM_CSS]PSJ78989.1 hypothetical protein C7N43_00680 [Sphingobacteriales bacterium UPWRP_1]
MKKLWTNYFSNNYTYREWFFQKLGFAVLIFSLAYVVVFNYVVVPLPESICLFVDCTLLLKYPHWVLLVITGLLILYLNEKWMIATLSALSILVFLLCVIPDSNGHLLWLEVLFTIPVVQLLAYLLYSGNTQELAKSRVQFSVAAIAAIYVLSGTTKLQDSHFTWVTQTQNLPIHVLKASFNMAHSQLKGFTLSNTEWAQTVANWMLAHPKLLMVLTAFALGIELFAFLAVINKRFAWGYGFLLILLHAGVRMAMSIVLPFIVLAMLVYYVNIFYFLWLVAYSVTVGIKNRVATVFNHFAPSRQTNS